MKTSTFSRGVWLSGLFVGFACGTQDVRGVGGRSGPRGSVTVTGPSVRALAVGPMVLHAFSLFPGGAIYAAPAITGTDQDCDLRAHPNQSPSRGGTVEADRRAVLTLSAGEVACLVTQTKGSFELLWHAAMAAPPASAKMAAVPAAAR